MQKIIVADTSCLILFHKIGELELLQRVFGQIIITEVVSTEFNRPFPHWFLIKNPRSNIYMGLTAKSKGVIDSVKPLLNKIQQTDFRISDELIQKVLVMANENI